MPMDEWSVSESLWLRSCATTRMKQNFSVVFSHINKEHLSQYPGGSDCILLSGTSMIMFRHSTEKKVFVCVKNSQTRLNLKGFGFVTAKFTHPSCEISFIKINFLSFGKFLNLFCNQINFSRKCSAGKVCETSFN